MEQNESEMAKFTPQKWVHYNSGFFSFPEEPLALPFTSRALGGPHQMIGSGEGRARLDYPNR